MGEGWGFVKGEFFTTEGGERRFGCRGWVPVSTGTTVGCTGTTVGSRGWVPRIEYGAGSVVTGTTVGSRGWVPRLHGNDEWEPGMGSRLHGNDEWEPGMGSPYRVRGRLRLHGNDEWEPGMGSPYRVLGPSPCVQLLSKPSLQGLAQVGIAVVDVLLEPRFHALQVLQNGRKHLGDGLLKVLDSLL